MSSEQQFQVDLRGIIDLLSDHLYSGPEVYLRELLQNAVDALVAREKSDIGFIAKESSIQIEVVTPSDESEPPTLIITDRGVGLTEAEVHSFLATIGQSSKRELSREDFIGQFGIGLLSAFIVSEEIVVITRSVDEGNPTLEWRGRVDGTYSTRVLDHDGEPGTQVFLRAKPGCFEFLQLEAVRNLATYYASHLPIPIEVVSDQGNQLINTSPPWSFSQKNHTEFVRQGMEYGSEVFSQRFLGMIPIRSEAGGIDGIAYVLPQASHLKSRRGHRVYLKGMLLSESIDNLMPEWAFFIRAVVNSTRLSPTASRESFHENDMLEQTRFEIGECLKQHLVELSKTDREMLTRIIGLHHLSIKALAVEDEEFFDLVSDWLPFETSLGTMSLGDYRKHQSQVRYVQNRDEFRQIVGVAAAQKICIIDAGYTYDEELLQRLNQRSPESLVERLEVTDLAQEFGELSVEERNRTFDFLQFARDVMQPFECDVQLRKFQPSTLTSLYTSNAQSGFMRFVDQSREVSDEMWGSILDGVASSQKSAAKAQLCLNYDNSVVQRLTLLDDESLRSEAIKMLYVQSLLLGHYPLRARETNVLSEGLINLIDAAVGRN